MRKNSAWKAHLAVAVCDWMREKCPRSYSLGIHWKLSNKPGRSWNWSGLWPNFLLHETSASRHSLMYSTWLCLQYCITWLQRCLSFKRHFQPVEGNVMLLLPKLITQCAPKIETIEVQTTVSALQSLLLPKLTVLKNPDLWYSSHVIHQHQEGEGEGGTVSLLCNSMSEDTMLYMCEPCITRRSSHAVSLAHWKQKQGNVGGRYHKTSTEGAPGFHFAVCSLLIDTQSSRWKKCEHVCVDAWMMCDVFWIYIFSPPFLVCTTVHISDPLSSSSPSGV